MATGLTADALVQSLMPTIQKMVNRSVQAALEGSLPLPVWRPGTVQQDAIPGSDVIVLVDGDLDPIHMVNLTGTGVRDGFRVMCLFTPPNGVWAVSVIGGLRTWQAIDELDLNAAGGTAIDFVDIPQSFSHLWLIGGARGASSGATCNPYMYLNGDATNSHYVNISADSEAWWNAAYGHDGYSSALARHDALPYLGVLPAVGSGGLGPISLMIPSYNIANLTRSVLYSCGYGVSASSGAYYNGVIRWTQSGEITRLQVRDSQHASGLFSAGHVTLLGMP